MFTSSFWTSYIFRVVHISSMVVICNSVINAKMTGQISKDYASLYAVAGILVLVSGFVNTFLLKPKEMGEKRKLWISYHHIKLITAVVLFTPILKLFTKDVETKINLQFYWMILALLLSPFARFYREHYVAKEKETKQKVEIDQKDTSNPELTP